MDMMNGDKTAPRRRYGEEIKAQILAECEAAGASVASVAMKHGINANVVHSWRRRVRAVAVLPAPDAAQFLPLNLAQPTHSESAPVIQVELRRGATTLSLAWPVASAAQLAAWSRELLR
jgi:transposase